MDRYIDVGFLFERGPMGVSKFISADYANGYNDFCRELLKIPAADVEPVRHGRWRLEYTNPYGDPRYKNRAIKVCSCCGWQNACRYNYCPNCGAKMDLEEENDNH